MNLRDRLHQWLQRYTGDPRRSLSLFTGGGFGFVFGMMIILISERLMNASLNQELVALAGLLMTIVGALIALWGYLGISLFKILIYLLERKTNNE